MFLRARSKSAHNPTIIMLCVCALYFICGVTVDEFGVFIFFFIIFLICLICAYIVNKLLDLCHSQQKIRWFFYGMAIKFKFNRILFINLLKNLARCIRRCTDDKSLYYAKSNEFHFSIAF